MGTTSTHSTFQLLLARRMQIRSLLWKSQLSMNFQSFRNAPLLRLFVRTSSDQCKWLRKYFSDGSSAYDTSVCPQLAHIQGNLKSKVGFIGTDTARNLWIIIILFCFRALHATLKSGNTHRKTLDHGDTDLQIKFYTYSHDTIKVLK